MKILKFLLVFFFFTFHAYAKELPKINAKFYLGIGDVHPSWTDYHDDPSYIRDYWTRGFGVDYKLNENYFIGLNFDETTFDLNYLTSFYAEEVHKQSIRVRFGYLF